MKRDFCSEGSSEIEGNLARISHQTLGKLETSVSPLHPRISLGKVYKPSLRKLLGASKKQSAQSSSRAGEKCGLGKLAKSRTIFNVKKSAQKSNIISDKWY